MISFLQRMLNREKANPTPKRVYTFDLAAIAALSTGINREWPKIGDTIVCATSCSMGVSATETGRYLVTGEPFNQRERYGSQSDSIMLVPTDGPRHPEHPDWAHTVMLPELRKSATERGVWFYVR